MSNYNFNAVSMPVSKKEEFNYSGTNNRWVFNIAFKKGWSGTSEVVFKVLRNKEVVAIYEANASFVESSIKIPFKCNDGDEIELECTNLTDTSDIEITHKSISF